MKGLEEKCRMCRDSRGHDWLSLQGGNPVYGWEREAEMGRANGRHENFCLSESEVVGFNLYSWLLGCLSKNPWAANSGSTSPQLSRENRILASHANRL